MDSSSDIQTEGDWIIVPASAVVYDASTSTAPEQYGFGRAQQRDIACNTN